MVRKEILISLLQVWWRWCVKRSSYHCCRDGGGGAQRDPHIIVTGMVEVVCKEILISLLQGWWRWCVKRSSYHCYRYGGGGA